MIFEEYNYKGFLVEVHQHPIYKDFEFVVKKDNVVKFTNLSFYDYKEDAKRSAELEIDLSEN
jgi:hypothetical protein